MKTINLKSALVTATVIAFITITSSANAQWRSERDDRDKTFREKIEEKVARERSIKERNDQWERRDVRWDHRDVKYNNGRYNRRNPYYRHDCDRKYWKKHHKHHHKHH